MTDTSQKLREALRIFAGCATPVDKSIDARGHAWSEAYLDQALLIARQALALPNAAPVGEHELPPLPVTSYQLYYQWSDDEDGCGGSEVVDGDAYTADQMRAYARAALSAGDAVDAQRYRWLRCASHDWGICEWDNQEAEWVRDSRGAVVINAAIDAAMRKGQP